MRKTFLFITIFFLLLSCNTTPQQENFISELFNQTSSASVNSVNNDTSGRNSFKDDIFFTHTNRKGTTYHHQHYSFSYSEEDEQSEWVAYELTSQELQGKVKRSNFFDEDPSVTTESAHPYEYRNSGYDKGHLAPSGDMKFDSIAMKECFYMSNISPQKKEFNSGIWNTLEKQTRTWARRFHKIYIITGPVFSQKKEQKIIYTDKQGKKIHTKITIPDSFYKIIYDFSYPGKEKMIGFLIPNKEEPGSIYDYAVTIDKIEEETGINFFSDMTDDLQKKYESSIDVSVWQGYSKK